MKKTKAFCLTVLTVSALLLSTVNAWAVSEEAQRHFDRGMAAVEMAKSLDDYAPAIKEFEQAIRLAPDWPDAYHKLGMAQEKAGRYSDAIISFKQYLRLSPNASDTATIKSLINKLEFKAEQTITESEIIDILVHGRFRGIKGRFKPVKGEDPDTGFPCRFRVTNGQLQACDPVPYSLEPCLGNKNIDVCLDKLVQCLPVKFDGKKLEYEITHYRCLGCEAYSYGPYKRSYKRDIVSTSPLQIRTKQSNTKEFGDRDDNKKHEYLEEWVNDR